MRFWPIIIWGVLIVIATVISLVIPWPGPTMVATVTLPQNTLLLPGPFVPRDFERKFISVQEGIAAGHRVTAEDLSTEPVVPAIQSGHGLAFAQVEWPDVLAGLNAGKTVRICRDASDLGAANVVAVRCDSTVPQPRCEAIVAIPLAPDGLVNEFAKPDRLKAASQC
jgi:hypothetical protein